jgi:type I restriction enzyme, S subunit
MADKQIATRKPTAAGIRQGKWKPYPAYKDSGIEWLGDVPAHWEIQKLKHIASIRYSNVDKHTIEGEEPVCLCNYTDVYYHEYINGNLDFMEATASLQEISKFELQEGDVIITKDSESWNDIAIPAYVVSDLPKVLCGYNLAQIRPNPELVRGRYLFRLCRS